MLEVLFDRALLGRTHQRRQIFFRKSGRNLDFQADRADQPAERITVHPLNDADALCGQPALLAEAKHVYAGAGADRGEERGERGRKPFRRGCCLAQARRQTQSPGTAAGSGSFCLRQKNPQYNPTEIVYSTIVAIKAGPKP